MTLESYWEGVKTRATRITDEPMKLASVSPASSIVNIGSKAITSNILKNKSVLQIAKEVIKKYPKTSGATAILAPSLVVAAKETVLNPTPLAKAYVSQASFTQDAFNLAKSPSKKKAVEFVQEHPFGTAVLGTAAVIGGGYTARNVISSALTFGASQNVDNKLKSGVNYVDTSSGFSGSSSNLSNILPGVSGREVSTKESSEISPPVTPLLAANLPPEVTKASYKNVSSSRKAAKKRKTLYTSPVNIRNNINIFNKN